MIEEKSQGESIAAKGPPIEQDRQAEQSLKGLGNLVERIVPWLFEVGSWIFAGLIAFNLIAISSLLTVGPVDAAIMISITAFACALPLNVAGIVLLRLIKDTKDIRIDDLALRAFQDAGFPGIDAYFPPAPEREFQQKRGSKVALLYSLGIAALSTAATLTGLIAALWHMAWWVGVVLLAMVIVSAVLLVLVIAHSLPPETEEEKELKKRHIE